MAPVEFQGGEDQQAGQPESKPQENTAQQALTPDEIKSLVKAAVADAYRGIQSSQSKQEKRIKDFIQQQVSALRGQGVEVTPELERALSNQARQQLTQPESEDEPTQPPAQATKVQAVQAVQGSNKRPSVEQLTEKLREKYGVEVNPDDPEAVDVETKGDWEDFEATYTAATIKKAKRTGASSPTKPKPVPAAVGTAGVDSQQSLEAAYKQEMLANKGKGMQVGEQIKAKYQKLGLDTDRVSFR